MNLNLIIALLQHKGILEAKEAEALAKRLATSMVPVNYAQAAAMVKTILNEIKL